MEDEFGTLQFSNELGLPYSRPSSSTICKSKVEKSCQLSSIPSTQPIHISTLVLVHQLITIIIITNTRYWRTFITSKKTIISTHSHPYLNYTLFLSFRSTLCFSKEISIFFSQMINMWHPIFIPHCLLYFLSELPRFPTKLVIHSP